MTVLQKTRQLPELANADGPVAEAEQIVGMLWPLLKSARDVIAKQNDEIRQLRAALARGTVNDLRVEIDETKEMLGGIEDMLEQSVKPQPVRVVAPTPGPSPKRRGERPYSPRARQVLDGEPLFIDYETTGLKKEDAVVELCVMDALGQVLLSTLVDPERHIPAEATAINGIGDGDVADAPTWTELAPELERLLSGCTVVAHNAKFEAKFTPDDWKVRWVCSKKLADGAMGKAAYSTIMHNPMRGGSLEARLHQCGLTAGPEHTAAGDCISTLRLVRYLAGDDRPVELL